MKKSQYAEPGAKRFYRARMKGAGLVRFEVAEGETDLTVFAQSDLSVRARRAVTDLRAGIIAYARRNPGFFEALEPLAAAADSPEIVARMCAAAAEWNVGPMAAVAGAVAEMVAESLLSESDEVIVENGGDIYVASRTPREIAIFAGNDSPFGDDLAVIVRPESGIRGVCTSSGTVGHSLSFGKADAVVAFAPSGAYADAAATAIANRVESRSDVEKVIDAERRRARLTALVVVIGDVMGAFGDIEFVS